MGPRDEHRVVSAHLSGAAEDLAFWLVTAPTQGRLRLMPAARFDGGEEWVSKGQVLAVVENGPSRHDVTSPLEARVAGVLVRDGEPVAQGQPIVWLDIPSDRASGGGRQRRGTGRVADGGETEE